MMRVILITKFLKIFPNLVKILTKTIALNRRDNQTTFFIFGQKIMIKKYQIKKELQIRLVANLLQKCRKLINMVFLTEGIFEL